MMQHVNQGDPHAEAHNDERDAISALQNAVANGVPTASRLVPVVVYLGESNSGGQAHLGELTSDEKAVRSSVQILNNTTFEFESLHIGVNNNIDHYNLPANTTHGWEAGLADEVEDGEWFDDRVFLVKTGQGGSTLAQWNQGGTFWSKFVQRINAAKAYFDEQKLIPVWYVYHTHGINDAIAGTAVGTWKTQMLELHTRVRGELGFVPILLVEEPSQYPTYNTAMAEIASEVAGNFMVDTGGLTMDDSNHWNSPGMKVLSRRLAEYAWRWGQHEGYFLGQAYALFNGGLSSGTPSDGGGSSEPPAAGQEFAGLGAFQTPAWTDFAYTSLVSGSLTRSSGGLPAGARVTTAINAQQPFAVEISYPDLVQTNAIIVYLDDDPDAYYTQGGNLFVAGLFQYGGNVYYVQSGDGQESLGTSGATNRLRMVKSGNDVDVYKSTDNGLTYAKVGTKAGVLLGKTNLYLKALFAIDQVGQAIPVTLARPA